MAEDTSQGTTAPAESAAQPKQDSFQLPEKFSGKSLEDVAKSYVELERKYGESSTQLKDLEGYKKLGFTPDQISEGLKWARNMKAALDQGLLVQKGQAPAGTAEAPKARKPWEDESWAYKSATEQANAIEGEMRSYVDGIAEQYRNQFAQQVQGLTQNDARQKSILMRAFRSALKNPGTDPEELLTEAAQIASKSPEDLMDMVFEMKANGPEAQQKKIDALVAEKVAAKIQEYEAKQLADVTSPTAPKMPFGIRKPENSKDGYSQRQNENKQILENLFKQGIKL